MTTGSGAVTTLLVAASVTTVFHLATRRRERKPTLWVFTVVGTAVGFGFGLRAPFLQPPPPEFQFLKGHAVSMTADPGVPGFHSFVYNFRGSPQAVMHQAIPELEARGFNTQMVQGTCEATRSDSEVHAQVTIYSGQLKGKHFAIDGDFLDVDESPNWVLVDVTVEDPNPHLYRWFIPPRT